MDDVLFTPQKHREAASEHLDMAGIFERLAITLPDIPELAELADWQYALAMTHIRKARAGWKRLYPAIGRVHLDAASLLGGDRR